MPDSGFIYEGGKAINVGSHGTHDFVYAEGTAVFDGGLSSLVYEENTGLGGTEINLDLQAGDQIQWATDADGNEIIFAPGEYEVTVSGRGWTHHDDASSDSFRCPTDENTTWTDGTDNWFYPPCSRIEGPGESFDFSRSMQYDVDGDGVDEWMMGPALVYDGAPNFNSHLGRDAVSNTRAFTEKDLAEGTGRGTITIASDSRFGVYNMDEPGAYSDNAADVTYTLASA